jgi:hypothetical protein
VRSKSKCCFPREEEQAPLVQTLEEGGDGVLGLLEKEIISTIDLIIDGGKQNIKCSSIPVF